MPSISKLLFIINYVNLQTIYKKLTTNANKPILFEINNNTVDVARKTLLKIKN